MLEEREPARQPSARAVAYDRLSNLVEITLMWAVVAALVAMGLWLGDLLDEPRKVVWLTGASAAVLVVLLLWFVVILPPFVVRFRRYELTESAVYVQRGVLSRHRALVPYARVQSVTSTRGPIERRFGLNTVVVQTAAGAEGISMLDDKVADELRDHISTLARRSADDL